jgi:hypothetical protein
MRRSTLVLLITPVLAACSGPGGDSPPALSLPPPHHLQFPLQQTKASGVHGTALVVPETASFTVALTAAGLSPNTIHAAHIDSGSCAAGGSVAVPLSPLRADTTGSATGTTSIPRPFEVPGSGWHISVSAGPDLVGASARSIACGDLSPPP